MMCRELQRTMTWAEDRALQRCNPSAVPEVGVKIGTAQVRWNLGRPDRSHTSHQHQSEKPLWQDATVFPHGRPLPLANADRSKFQFTLNQDNGTILACSHRARA